MPLKPVTINLHNGGFTATANAGYHFDKRLVFESDQAKEDFKKAVKYAANDEIYLSIYNSLAGAGCTEDANAYLEEALGKKAGRDAKNYTVKGRFYLTSSTAST